MYFDTKRGRFVFKNNKRVCTICNIVLFAATVLLIALFLSHHCGCWGVLETVYVNPYLFIRVDVAHSYWVEYFLNTNPGKGAYLTLWFNAGGAVCTFFLLLGLFLHAYSGAECLARWPDCFKSFKSIAREMANYFRKKG